MGIEPGEIFEYFLAIDDNQGNTLTSQSITIEGVMKGTTVLSSWEIVLSRQDWSKSCFASSVGKTFTAGDVLQTIGDTTDEVTDTFLGGISSLVSGLLASIRGGLFG